MSRDMSNKEAASICEFQAEKLEFNFPDSSSDIVAAIRLGAKFLLAADWRPMSEAPKDFSDFIAYDSAGGMHIVSYSMGAGGEMDFYCNSGYRPKLIGWIPPLPVRKLEEAKP